MAVIIFGSASNAPYHIEPPAVSNCHADPVADSCKLSYIQEYTDHTIAVAEYSERGNYFREDRFGNIIDMISSKSDSSDGLIAIVFVHGWKHNADQADSNLVNFKRVIAEIAKDKDRYSIGKRQLVGIYAGWRGKSLQVPYINALTYWGRKSAAEQFGNTGLARLLIELDKIDRSKPENVLVTIGHSFGGAAVLTAASKPLLTRVLEPINAGDITDQRCSNGKCGIGDGVFLLNPAIEANQTIALLEATASTQYDELQPPLLVSLSSEADNANKYLFPLGQTFGLLATSLQTSLQRSYYKNRKSGEEVRLREETLDSTAVGNFSPFLTHRLDVPDHEILCEEPILKDPPLVRCIDYSSADQCGPKRFPKGFDLTPKNVEFSDRDPYNPLYFIRTNRHFMDGHNDIFNPHVVAFLTAQLNHGLKAIGSADGSVSGNYLYQQPADLKSEYERFLEYSCEINFEDD